jgi:probable phosphoglycerate mutase
LNELWLVRHGETEWTKTKQHTSSTDLDLTDEGAEQAARLRPRLSDHAFSAAFTSPSLRARRTAELAGFPDAIVLSELREFEYGEYEGLTTDEIVKGRPDWNQWRDGCPGGETVDIVAARVDEALARVSREEGDVVVFGHGHTGRVLGARYLGLDGRHGANLVLDPGSISILGKDHGRPAILLWNEAQPHR